MSFFSSPGNIVAPPGSPIIITSDDNNGIVLNPSNMGMSPLSPMFNQMPNLSQQYGSVYGIPVAPYPFNIRNAHNVERMLNPIGLRAPYIAPDIIAQQYLDPTIFGASMMPRSTSTLNFKSKGDIDIITTDVMLSSPVQLGLLSATAALPVAALLSPDSPIGLAVTNEFSQPMAGLYLNYNNDPITRNNITKHYYYKVLDKWLYSDMIELLNYLIVDNNGTVSLIKNMSNYKKGRAEENSRKQINDKVEFLEKFLFTRKDLYEILIEFTKDTNIQWIHMARNEYILKKYIQESIENKLKYLVKKSKSM